MLRKIGLLVAALTLTVGLAPPASAIHHAERCEVNEIDYGVGYGKWAKVCVMVNSRDVALGSDIEALAVFEEAQGAGYKVQFAWVHLYKENEGAVRVTGDASGWLGWGDSYSTNWYCGCSAMGQAGDFYAIAKWRFRYPDQSLDGWGYSEYETTRSVGWVHFS